MGGHQSQRVFANKAWDLEGASRRRECVSAAGMGENITTERPARGRVWVRQAGRHAERSSVFISGECKSFVSGCCPRSSAARLARPREHQQEQGGQQRLHLGQRLRPRLNLQQRKQALARPHLCHQRCRQAAKRGAARQLAHQLHRVLRLAPAGAGRRGPEGGQDSGCGCLLLCAVGLMGTLGKALGAVNWARMAL